MADEFDPSNREHWVGIFAEGMDKFYSKREEAEAKARAAEAANNPPPPPEAGNDGENGKGGNENGEGGNANGGDERPNNGWDSFAAKLLGGTR